MLSSFLLIISVWYLVPKVIENYSRHKYNNNQQFKITVGVIFLILVLTNFAPILGSLVEMAIFGLAGFVAFVNVCNLFEN